MKKILSIFSSFGMIMSSILSITSSVNPEVNATIDSEVNVVIDPEVKTKIETATKKLSNLTGMIFGASNLKDPNKTDDLNTMLFATDKIKAIIKDDIKVKNDKFTLKVESAVADNINLKDKTVVTASGKIMVNGQESDAEFSFNITLNKSCHSCCHKNDIVIALSKLTGITFEILELGTTDKVKTLNDKLLAYVEKKVS